MGKFNPEHGMARTPEYDIWVDMKGGCYNPNHHKYPDYGGRGIMVCDEWRHSFVPFLNHIGKRPDPNLSLDRINNDGNYEPGNVRWATRIEQMRNQRKSIYVELDGQRLALKEICLRRGVSYEAMLRRLYCGWTPERAFSTPIKKVDQSWRRA
jgi:hypothetical protein